MAIVEMWTFTAETAPNIDLTGFKVEATDGEQVVCVDLRRERFV